MSVTHERNQRSRIVLELASIVTGTVLYLALFPRRPMYLDAGLALLAAGLLGIGTPRSRAVWAVQPPAPGNRRQRLAAAAQAAVLFSAPVVMLFLVIALAAGHAQGGWPGALARAGNWHLPLALALYFPWALLQQYVFQFYLFGRLLYLLPPAVAVGITAAAFSAVHYPRIPVMAATLIAGSFWVSSYRRHRTLLPLAASHALLGTTLHYWVLNHDLLAAWLPGP